MPGLRFSDGSISPETFAFLQSLPVLLLAVAGGIAAVGGALFGAIAYALFFFIIPDLYPSLENLLAIAPGLLGISLGRNPNGAVNETVRSFRDLRAQRAARARGNTPPKPDWDRLGLDRELTPEDRATFDRELALDTEPLYAAARR